MTLMKGKIIYEMLSASGVWAISPSAAAWGFVTAQTPEADQPLCLIS